MVSLTLTVETVVARHCFVTLPQRAFSSADVESALATSFLVLSVSPQTGASDADKVYVGWSGTASYCVGLHWSSASSRIGAVSHRRRSCRRGGRADAADDDYTDSGVRIS